MSAIEKSDTQAQLKLLREIARLLVLQLITSGIEPARIALSLRTTARDIRKMVGRE